MNASTATVETRLWQVWPRAFRTASGQARPSQPRHTVSSMPQPLRAPRTRLAWRLGGFVTNHHEQCGL